MLGDWVISNVRRVDYATYSDFPGIRALNAKDAFVIDAGVSMLKEMRLLLDDGVEIHGIAVYSKGTALCNAARLVATRSVAFSSNMARMSIVLPQVAQLH